MDVVLEAERETLKLRLLAIAAVLAGLYARQDEVLRRPETAFLMVGVALVYLAYTLSLRTVILPRVQSPYVVYPMIVVDTAFLLTAVHLAGGLQSTTFVLFPVIVIFYAIHLNYRSSFFAAIVISLEIAGYALLTNLEGLGSGTVLTFQLPLLFLLAYFSGFLGQRATEEREKRETLQEFIRIESGTSGLRDVVRVFTKTLELYEEWVTSYVSRTSEKEASAKLRFSLSIDAQYALAHYAFGRIYAQSGQLNRAEEALRRSLVFDPNLLEAQRELSEVLLRQGRFQDALEPATRYAEASQNDWLAHQNLAVIYKELYMEEMSTAAQERALAVSTGEDREALASFFDRLRAEHAAP